MKRLFGLWLVVVLSAFGLGSVTAAAAEGTCDGRVFAVNAGSGHLVEIASCAETSRFGVRVEVDAADWRGYHAIFVLRDGAAAIVYAVTESGELWWRRQESAGAGLGAPVRVGASVNWARPMIFAAAQGFLEIGAPGSPILTYRHQGWSSGGTTVSAEANLFSVIHGPSVVGLGSVSSYAVGIFNGTNYRVWRNHPKNMPKIDQDVWYASGSLPAGTRGVVGDGASLHGLNAAGEIVLLRQTGPAVEVPTCMGRDARPWQVMATASGSYVRVIVPVSRALAWPPVIGMPPENLIPNCPGNSDGNPWEWQSPGT